jgi:hypothetical protein
MAFVYVDHTNRFPTRIWTRHMRGGASPPCSLRLEGIQLQPKVLLRARARRPLSPHRPRRRRPSRTWPCPLPLPVPAERGAGNIDAGCRRTSRRTDSWIWRATGLAGLRGCCHPGVIRLESWLASWCLDGQCYICDIGFGGKKALTFPLHVSQTIGPKAQVLLVVYVLNSTRFAQKKMASGSR